MSYLFISKVSFVLDHAFSFSDVRNLSNGSPGQRFKMALGRFYFWRFPGNGVMPAPEVSLFYDFGNLSRALASI